MKRIKRSAVKGHMRPPFLTKIHVIPSESRPDATGFSGADSDATEANPSGFSEDFVAEHSSGTTLAGDNSQSNSLIGSIGPPVPSTSKSVQS